MKPIRLVFAFIAAVCFVHLLAHPIAAASLSLQIASDPHPSFAPPAGGRGDAGSPIISLEGRYVLFASTANNLLLTTSSAPIPVLAPASINVYLRDRVSLTTKLVSANVSGTAGGNGDSLPAAISTNGQYALFESSASDLVPDDTNELNDVFVRDVFGNATFLVSANTNGVPGNGVSRSAVMTPGGRYVAFVSAATDLVPGDTNNIPDVFVRDVVSNVTTLVSAGATASGSTLSGFSESPAISSDGRYVAFLSAATNLVPGLGVTGDIYVRDLISGTTAWASTNARVIAKSVLGHSNIFSCNLSLSADGSFIAFEVVSNGAMAYTFSGIVLRHNLGSGITDTVATNANVSPGSFLTARSLDMTADGRFVAFIGNVPAASPVVNTAVYLWDAQAGTNALVSANRASAVAASGICRSPAVSADGRYVAFISSGTDLVTNALSEQYHLYLCDTAARTIWLVDAGVDGTGVGVGAMTYAPLSADAQSLAFDSFQANLAAADQNSNSDVFVFAQGTGDIELCSVRDAALPGSGPTISWLTNGAQTYRVQFQSDLNDAAWQEAIGGITLIGKRGYFTELAPGSVQKFYRMLAY